MFASDRFLKENFRDADAIIALLAAYSLKSPTQEAAKKWFQRGSIPSEWLPVLICVLELEQGKPVGLSRYLSVGGTCA